MQQKDDLARSVFEHFRSLYYRLGQLLEDFVRLSDPEYVDYFNRIKISVIENLADLEKEVGEISRIEIIDGETFDETIAVRIGFEHFEDINKTIKKLKTVWKKANKSSDIKGVADLTSSCRKMQF